MSRRTRVVDQITTKRGRLEVPISPDQKELLQHAVITLTARDSATFVEAILNQPVPSEQLHAAATDYLREVEER